VQFNGLWRPRLTAENAGLLYVFDAGDTCACVCSPDSLPRVVGYEKSEGEMLDLISGLVADWIADQAPRVV